ncbi:unnamed protein product [Cylicocyclus nassatus]|uniref:Uncharacterized protein n=1 Tax=Cylicocyclus nassatus TaxID=53992 RepID=A0AA36H2Z6_CYLNA|nr:unnamed protein product [Cylicocyclus nassatus]
MALSMFLTATVVLQPDLNFENFDNFESPQNIKEFMNMVNATYDAVRVQERIVLEDGSHVVVADILLDDNNPEHKNVDALRVIGTLDVENSVHSAFRLILPSELSKRNIDSSKWKVDCSYIQPNTCYHICTETVFYCDAINFSRDNEANVLSLGLGGGIMDCFLHYYFPKINITVVEISAQMVYVAYKWFNFEQDNCHHLVIADGAEFVKQQALKGVQYDAIILDACYSESTHKILCPTESFLEERTIQQLSKLVSDKGIIVINAAPGTITASEESELLLESFSKFFQYCNTRNATGENEVVYCMHRPPVLQKHIDLLSVMRVPV